MGQGSSPLVRGALPLVPVCVPDVGIIPARAGSTLDVPSAAMLAGDHPRSCGEHATPSDTSPPKEGSSPLVRGARQECGQCGLIVGIIPARAGSTAASSTSVASPQDHPRSCGEHRSSAALRSCLAGSSPLVRGAPVFDIAVRASAGIIPARAGSTERIQGLERCSGDHPRSCGEHLPIQPCQLAGAGSSPLVRGARHRPRRQTAATRIIPARAGSTQDLAKLYTYP